jgi:hypothetical protein
LCFKVKRKGLIFANFPAFSLISGNFDVEAGSQRTPSSDWKPSRSAPTMLVADADAQRPTPKLRW